MVRGSSKNLTKPQEDIIHCIKQLINLLQYIIMLLKKRLLLVITIFRNYHFGVSGRKNNNAKKQSILFDMSLICIGDLYGWYTVFLTHALCHFFPNVIIDKRYIPFLSVTVSMPLLLLLLLLLLISLLLLLSTIRKYNM